MTSKKGVPQNLLFAKIKDEEGNVMVNVENEIIGRRLQDIRESAHMDYYDMAKMLGISFGD